MSEPRAIPIRWSTNKLIVVGDNPMACNLTITPNSGILQGSFIHPETGAKTTLKGAVLQGPGLGAGWFLGTNQGGALLIRSTTVSQP